MDENGSEIEKIAKHIARPYFLVEITKRQVLRGRPFNLIRKGRQP